MAGPISPLREPSPFSCLNVKMAKIVGIRINTASENLKKRNIFINYHIIFNEQLKCNARVEHEKDLITSRPGQKLQTQIRLLLKSLIRVFLVCYSLKIPALMTKFYFRTEREVLKFLEHLP